MRRPVVIVEDDEFIRENLKDFLESEGFQTFLAVNGKEGLDLIRKLRGNCLVLLDLQMPVITGEQLLDALKAEVTELRSVPVVVLSARREPPHVPVSGFLRKPIDLDALLKLVEHNTTNDQ